MVWIKIALTPGEMMLLGCLYRNLNCNITNNEELINLLDIVKNEEGTFSRIVLVGDFILPKINWKNWTVTGDSFSNKLIEEVRENFLNKHITEPTGETAGQYSNTFDFLLTQLMKTSFLIYTASKSPLGESDHCVLTFNVEIQIPEIRLSAKVGRMNFNRVNYEEMR